ncbi:MAG: hypothetical protein ABSG54_00525 [Terriglobia bacterium]|jgi:hypothetical protein
MLKTVVSTIAAVLLVAAVAMAEKGRTIDVYTNAILPDGQELKAGKYQVVVSADEKEIQFLQSNKVVAKHACRCMGHDGPKHRYSQARYAEGADKKQKLTEVRFAGSSCVLNLDVQQGM